MKWIAICDDEIGTCSDLEKMILDFAGSHALQIETEVFYSGSHSTVPFGSSVHMTWFSWIFSYWS